MSFDPFADLAEAQSTARQEAPPAGDYSIDPFADLAAGQSMEPQPFRVVPPESGAGPGGETQIRPEQMPEMAQRQRREIREKLQPFLGDTPEMAAQRLGGVPQPGFLNPNPAFLVPHLADLPPGVRLPFWMEAGGAAANLTADLAQGMANPLAAMTLGVSEGAGLIPDLLDVSSWTAKAKGLFRAGKPAKAAAEVINEAKATAEANAAYNARMALGQRGVAATYAAQMATGVPEQVQQAYETLQDPNASGPATIKSVLAPIVGAGMAASLGAHALEAAPVEAPGRLVPVGEIPPPRTEAPPAVETPAAPEAPAPPAPPGEIPPGERQATFGANQLPLGVSVAQWEDMTHLSDNEQIAKYGTSRAQLIQEAVMADYASRQKAKPPVRRGKKAVATAEADPFADLAGEEASPSGEAPPAGEPPPAGEAPPAGGEVKPGESGDPFKDLAGEGEGAAPEAPVAAEERPGLPAQHVEDLIREVAPAARVQVSEEAPPVNDEGLPIRGRLEEDGSMTLFSKAIHTPAEVRGVMVEELGHLAMRDPRIGPVAQRLLDSITPEEKAAMVRLGYGEGIAGEEALMRRLVKGDLDLSQRTMWNQLKDWLKDLYRRFTGKEAYDSDIRDLWRAAMKAGRRPGPERLAIGNRPQLAGLLAAYVHTLAEARRMGLDAPLKIDEFGDYPRRLGTRKPTGGKRTEEAHTHPTVIDMETFRQNPEAMRVARHLIKRHYPQALIDKAELAKVDPLEAFIEHMKDNQLWLHDKFAPRLRGRAQLWYDGGRRVTLDWENRFKVPRYGVAGTIAALSPKRDWFKNLSLAERVLHVVKTQQQARMSPEMKALVTKWGGPDSHFAKPTRLAVAAEIPALRSKPFNKLDSFQKGIWIRAYSDAHMSQNFHVWSPEGQRMGLKMNDDGVTPEKVDMASFDQLSKAVAIAENPTRENISEQLGDAHKVRNFYNNLLVPNDLRYGDVTIDTHQAGASVLKPVSAADREAKHALGSGLKGERGPVKDQNRGISGLYAPYAEAIRRAAAERNLLPRQMQSIVWEAVRGLFPDKWKTEKTRALVNGIWQKYINGEQDLAATREEIFHEATKANRGEIKLPDWDVQQSDRAGSAQAAAPGQPGELLRPVGVGSGEPGRGGSRGAAAGPAAGIQPEAGNQSERFSVGEPAGERRPADPFYSRLERTVEQSPQGKASGAQWKATIRNSKLGTNLDEYNLVGVDDLFHNDQKYTQQEVLDQLKRSQIEVKDVTLGGGDIPLSDEMRGYFRSNNQAPVRTQWGWLRESQNLERSAMYYRDAGHTSTAERLFRLSEEAKSLAQEASVREEHQGPVGDTQFSQYQLQGQTKEGSYREVLLTAPQYITSRAEQSLRSQREKTWTKVERPDGSHYFMDAEGRHLGDTVPEAHRMAETMAQKPTALSWRDGHPEYNAHPNPVVRLRYNERTDAAGKRTLFLEEVQPPTGDEFAKMPELFQKNWRQIAFKWALSKAAREGYDAVGWTTGEQQVKRWPYIERQVNKISWLPNQGTDALGQYVQIYPKSGAMIWVRTDELGRITESNHDRLVGQSLERLVGKEVEAKIDARHHGVLEGEDLKFGGHGLRKLYDQDFPNVVRDLRAVKKGGGKVGAAEIETARGPKFLYGAEDQPGAAQLERRIDQLREHWHDPATRTAEGWRNWNTTLDRQAYNVRDAMEAGSSYQEAINKEGSVELANRLNLGGQWKTEGRSEPIHSLPITPEMRDAVVTRGQERFSVGEAGGERKDRLPGETESTATTVPRTGPGPSLEEIGARPPGSVPAVGTRLSMSGSQGEEEASPMKSTLPRRVDPGLYRTPAGEPIGVHEIRQQLAKALDIPVRKGEFRQRAYGIFKKRPEVIRLGAMGDTPTLMHEVGHYLHQLLWQNSNWGKVHDPELLKLGARTSRPSYTEGMRRKEGVAEFAREYITDRSKALAKAPKFTAYFEHELATNHPQVWDIVQKAQRDVGRYINQGAEQRVDSMISRKEEDTRVPLSQRLRKLYTDWTNDLAPFERATHQLESYGLPGPEGQHLRDLATNFSGVAGKTEHSLKYRQIDLHGNDVGPSMREILRGVPSLEDLGRYLVSKRALEKNAQGIRTGIANQDANLIVRKYGPQYHDVADKLRTFQRNSLNMLRDSGLFSDADIEHMEERNLDYVPFYRVIEGAKAAKAGGGAAGGGEFINTPQGVGRMVGSDAKIVDPLESIVKNAFAFRSLAERNQVGAELTHSINKVQGGGRVADRIATKLAPVEVPHEEIVNALKEHGIDLSHLDPKTQSLAFKLWQLADQQANPRKGIFTVFRDGQRERWQMDDPELYRSLTRADANDAKMFSKGPFTTVMRGVTKILRAGATLSPEFIARNPFKDQITAGINSRHGFVPFWDGFRGLLHVVGKDKWYQDWVKSGGRYSDFVASDRNNLQDALRDVVKDPAQLKQALSWANPRNALRALHTLSEAGESATRVSEYRRAIQSGASPLEAANASKDVTVNFARGGFKGKALNQLSAFFNASMQDFDLTVRRHKERPLQTMAKAAMYITGPSLLTWYLGKDDPKIQGLPEWRKNFFWNLHLGGHVWSFPKPFLLGQLYGSSVERAADYVTKRDPNAMTKWAKATFEATPFDPVNIVPTVARPVAEAWGNKSMYRGTSLDSQTQEKLEPWARYSPQSSQLARSIAAELPTSWNLGPQKLDNAMRGYLGGLGRYGSDFIDWTAQHTKLGDIPNRPAKDWTEYPVARGFVNSPYQASAWVDRFYSAASAAGQTIDTAKSIPATPQTAKQASFLKENKDRIDWYGSHNVDQKMALVKKSLGQINKAMTMAQNDPEMTPEEKRQRLLDLGAQRDAIAEQGFKQLIQPGDRLKYR